MTVFTTKKMDITSIVAEYKTTWWNILQFTW